MSVDDDAPTRAFAHVSFALDADTWTQLLETMTRAQLVAFVRDQIRKREDATEELITMTYSDPALLLAEFVVHGKPERARKLADQILANHARTLAHQETTTR